MALIDTLTVRIEADTDDLEGDLSRLTDAVADTGAALAANLRPAERSFADLAGILAVNEAGIEQVGAAIGDLAPQSRRADRAAQDMGLALIRAFDSAIVRGRSLRQVLTEIALDLARLVLRDVGRGSVFSGLGTLFPGFPLGGGLADGGEVRGGIPYLVGERGPELFVPDVAGAIVPNGAIAAGPTFNFSYHVDARGADAGVEARILAAMQETESRTLAAVRALADRGGPFARAVGRR